MTISESSPSPAHFALIPAAGVGARIGADIPKQYMPLVGKPMLQYALDSFAANAAIAHTFVVVSDNDAYIAPLLAALPHLHGKVSVLRHGGATRQETVRNGLQALRGQITSRDWVLVHDAARPGLDQALLDKLLAALHDDEVGGLWAAQTPQMFRYALLLQAMEQANERIAEITDDASAIEMLGLSPKLVEGSPRNFKVTLAQDIALAELFLQG